MIYKEILVSFPSNRVTSSAVQYTTLEFDILLMFHSVYPSFVAFSEQTVLAVCHSVFVQRDYGVALCCLKDNAAARGMLCERLPSATLSCITSLFAFFLCFTCVSLSPSECNSVAIHALTQRSVRLHRTLHVWLPMQCIGSSQLFYSILFFHLWHSSI